MPWTPCNPRLEKGLGRGGLLGRRVHMEPGKSEHLGGPPGMLQPTPSSSPSA